MSGSTGLWRRRALRRLKFGAGRELVTVGEEAEVLGWALADALSGCLEFRSLEEHAVEAWRRSYGKARHLEAACREAASRLGLAEAGRGPHAVELALAALAARGFLVERGSLFREAPRALADAGPARLAVLALGDARTLERALAAGRELLPQLGAGARLAAYDCGDGLEPQRREAARAAGARFVGRAERQRLAGALAGAGADEAAAQAALLGWPGVEAGPSVAYNAAWLEGADGRLVAVDDAALLRAAPAPAAGPGLRLVAGIGRRDWLFGEPARRSLGAGSGGGAVLAILEALGRPAAALAAEAEAQGRLDLSEIGDGWTERLGASVIAVAHAGAAGPGLLDAASALRLGAAVKRTLTADGAALRAALEGGFTASFASTVTLQDRVWARLHALGVDARRMIPPMLPSRHGSRGLFCRLMARMHPDAAAAEVPWIAAFSPTETSAGGGLTLSVLVDELLAGARTLGPAREPGAALRGAAGSAKALAALEEAEWSRWARNVRWNALRARLDSAKGAAGDGDAPAPWREAARRRLRELQDSLVDPLLLTPREAGPVRDPAEGAARGRALVLRASALLEAWPTVWEAARRLRDGH